LINGRVSTSFKRWPSSFLIHDRKDLEDLGICGWLTALRHEKKGKLKACRIGRLARYRGADIIQWLEGCKS
jgi:hypothetical protein